VGFLKQVIFLFWSNYINTEDNYERLIDVLSQISKLSNFSVLDLVDFMMHRWFPVAFFVLIQSHTCACNGCIVSSFVIIWQFRRIDHNGPYLFFLLSNCTYNSHIIKNENFLVYSMHILDSCIIYKFQTLKPECPPSQPHIF